MNKKDKTLEYLQKRANERALKAANKIAADLGLTPDFIKKHNKKKESKGHE